jgi:Ca2+:H+ antiporter
MHSSQTSRWNSRTMTSFFPPLHKFPYRNSPLTSSYEITLASSREGLTGTIDQGSTQDSTIPLVEEPSRQNAQPEHDHKHGNGSITRPLQPPWSPSPMPSPVDACSRCASPEFMTPSEISVLQRSPSAAESFREPQLSWMVTILLLTLVTVVSNESARGSTC